MASYARLGIPNEYDSGIHIETTPDSDESFSDSDEHTSALRHLHAHHVAFDGEGRESDEQRGLFNRGNFFVHNFNAVRHHNLTHFGIWSPRMSRTIPIGGKRAFKGASTASSVNLENTVAMWIGWSTGIIPIVLLVTAAYCSSAILQYWMSFLLLTSLFLQLFSLYNLRRNLSIFFNSPFMVPVTITSGYLTGGLRNTFHDVTLAELAELAVIGKRDRDMISRSLDGPSFQSSRIRLMFYSPHYFSKYMSIPQSRVILLILLNSICFLVSVLVFVCNARQELRQV